MNETLDSKEAADYLKISVSTLANLRSQGKAPKSYTPNNGKVIYYKADLDEWIKAKKDEQ